LPGTKPEILQGRPCGRVRCDCRTVHCPASAGPRKNRHWPSARSRAPAKGGEVSRTVGEGHAGPSSSFFHRLERPLIPLSTTTMHQEPETLEPVWSSDFDELRAMAADGASARIRCRPSVSPSFKFLPGPFVGEEHRLQTLLRAPLQPNALGLPPAPGLRGHDVACRLSRALREARRGGTDRTAERNVGEGPREGSRSRRSVGQPSDAPIVSKTLAGPCYAPYRA